MSSAIKRVRTILLSAAFLISQVSVVFLVLTRNLSSGVYPSDADAIVIPLVETTVLALLVFAAVCGGILLPTRRRFLRIASFLLVAAACLLSTTVAASYVLPHHYEVTAIFGASAFFYAWWAFKALTTSPAPHMRPDRTPQNLA